MMSSKWTQNRCIRFGALSIVGLAVLAVLINFGSAVSRAGRGPVLVDGLDTAKLPYTLDSDGTKVFHLVAQKVQKSLYPGFNNGVPVTFYGFNGSMPGPVIEATEGDHLRIYVKNELPEPTSVHWHGLEVPNDMDGVGGLTQKPIMPGQEYLYEFTLHQNGTFMYHSGYNQAYQVGMGLAGMFIVHPKRPYEPAVDKDYAMLLQMFVIPPGGNQPDPMSMGEQYFTINGVSGPYTKHVQAKVGERVRIRIANLSTMNHPIHIHGHTFVITGTDGGRIQDSAQWPGSTVIVGAGEARDIEFNARGPGMWMFHCHFLHHVMNDMSRPMVPGQPMDMSPVGNEGMHTMVDVTQ